MTMFDDAFVLDKSFSDRLNLGDSISFKVLESETEFGKLLIRAFSKDETYEFVMIRKGYLDDYNYHVTLMACIQDYTDDVQDKILFGRKISRDFKMR